MQCYKVVSKVSFQSLHKHDNIKKIVEKSGAMYVHLVDVKKVNWTKSTKIIYLGILVSEIINDLFLRPWVSIVHGVMTRQC